MSNFIVNPYIFGAEELSITYKGHSLDSGDSNSYTFSSKDLGAASGTRRIFVAAHTVDTETDTHVSAVTIGGVSATVHVTEDHQLSPPSGVASCVGIASALVPSGTTGDIVVTWTNTTFRCGMSYWVTHGLQDGSPTDTQSDTDEAINFTLNVPVDGLFICAGTTSSGGASNASWTNAPEDYDAAGESGENYTGGGQLLPAGDATRSITCNFTSNSEDVGVGVSWK